MDDAPLLSFSSMLGNFDVVVLSTDSVVWEYNLKRVTAPVLIWSVVDIGAFRDARFPRRSFEVEFYQCLSQA